MVPLLVLVLILLLIEGDPKKPWSGVAFVAALLTVVGIGWAVGRWVLLVVPAVVFAGALIVSERQPVPAGAGACDPTCAPTAAGLAGYAVVLGSLLAIGVVLRRVMAWISS